MDAAWDTACDSLCERLEWRLAQILNVMTIVCHNDMHKQPSKRLKQLPFPSVAWTNYIRQLSPACAKRTAAALAFYEGLKEVLASMHKGKPACFAPSGVVPCVVTIDVNSCYCHENTHAHLCISLSFSRGNGPTAIALFLMQHLP